MRKKDRKKAANLEAQWNSHPKRYSTLEDAESGRNLILEDQEGYKDADYEEMFVAKGSRKLVEAPQTRDYTHLDVVATEGCKTSKETLETKTLT